MEIRPQSPMACFGAGPLLCILYGFVSVCVCARDILSIQAFIGALMLMHTFNLVVCASLHAYYLLRNCLSFIFFPDRYLFSLMHYIQL